jgi:hypothetical protein
MEIGGDAGQSDGAEPSIEHSQGVVDCQSGYEWWLAEQAVARDPGITLMGLQWSAPGWVGAGTLWTQADIGYLIDWLNCAKSHHLTISYIGGWDENGFKVPSPHLASGRSGDRGSLLQGRARSARSA